jgi:hypothetical protein
MLETRQDAAAASRRAPLTNVPARWAAELEHVQEVSLAGTADLAFWTERLRPEGLTPAESGGRAKLLIVAASARFLGLRFRELSVSVLAAPRQASSGADAAFLVQAFNSSRLFAFCERTLFSTPYLHAGLRLSTSLPARVRLIDRGRVVFDAAMGAEAPARSLSRSGEESWEGPVFLPARRRGAESRRRCFFARIRGRTLAYPFLPASDRCTIEPAPRAEVLQALLDSRFEAEEWRIREDAAHAKSKTYATDDAAAGEVHA